MTEYVEIIRWEDPPPHGRGERRSQPVRRYETAAAQLRADRGRWALLMEFTAHRHAGLASNITLGKIRAFAPAGDFEAVTRRCGDTTRVYARYLGDGDAS